MADKKTTTVIPDQLIALLLVLPWMDILAETYKLLRTLWRGLADEGMYEVLGYESTLELLDCQGKRASRVQAPPGCELVSPQSFPAWDSSSTLATYVRMEPSSFSPKAFSSKP